ncbi:MAG: DnaJ domain-containing protein [Rhizobiaceae bacterium]
MTFFLVLAIALLAVGLFGSLLLRADPAAIARMVRLIVPGLVALLGLGMTLAGRAGFGIMLMATAIGWLSSQQLRGRRTRSPGRRSSVRTAALEMELDHDSGAMDGLVLAGRHEGKTLGRMDLVDLLELHRELGSDPDSTRLLEAYLDSRFTVWRQDAHADAGGGLGEPPAAGAMTEQEAYQILGLEPGAAAADIRKAHRRLMQRVHPDLGGSSFLAARINQAKDILLRGH